MYYLREMERIGRTAEMKPWEIAEMEPWTVGDVVVKSSMDKKLIKKSPTTLMNVVFFQT